MTEAVVGTDTAQTIAADTPEAVTTATVEPGTTEQAAEVETDEQKNARLLKEREDRSRKNRDSIQKRFNELTAERNAERRRADMALEILQRSQGQTQQSTAQPSGDIEPRRDQFESYEDFVNALATHRAEQAATKHFERLTRQQREQEQRSKTEQTVGQMRTAFAEKVSAFAKSTPDFNDVISRDDIEIPDTVTALLHDADDPGALLYAFGKNPELLKQFEGHSINRQGYLLGRLEHSLKSSTPQISKAPAPGQPVTARSAPPNSDAPSDSDSADVWLRKREAQLRKR